MFFRYFSYFSSPASDTFHICRYITVKLRTASPVIFTATSFQCPKRERRLMYSSARFTPPVKATFPSITTIFLWSRLFWEVDKKGTIGANILALIPYSSSSLGYRSGSSTIEHIPSYITRTSTPSFTFSFRISSTVSHITPRSMIKYSRKINFSAFFNSASRSSNLSSPTG